MSKPRLRLWPSRLAFFAVFAASVPLGRVPPVLLGFVLGYCQEDIGFDPISVLMVLFFFLFAPLAVILSWYGHYLILGRLPIRIESAGEPVRRLAEDAFLLYYNPK